MTKNERTAYVFLLCLAGPIALVLLVALAATIMGDDGLMALLENTVLLLASVVIASRFIGKN